MKEKHWFIDMIPVQKAVFWLITVFIVAGVLFSLSFTLQNNDDDSGNPIVQTAALQANQLNGLRQRYRNYDVMIKEHHMSALLCDFSDKFNSIHLKMGIIKIYQLISVLRL